MAGKISSAATAVSVAVLVGSCVFGFLAALTWSLAHILGLDDFASTSVPLLALPAGIAAGLWIGRKAYAAERSLSLTETPPRRRPARRFSSFNPWKE